MSDCQICGRKVDSEEQFCEYHAIANENIINSFEKWQSAMEIQWDVYLEKLDEEESLGRFAKEVVEFLMQRDDSSESP
ncbi:MAG: hypothetical protein ACW98Y_00830 [Candidatus Thorarchaeota archaeon]|jgi:hypothetical protein